MYERVSNIFKIPNEKIGFMITSVGTRIVEIRAKWGMLF